MEQSVYRSNTTPCNSCSTTSVFFIKKNFFKYLLRNNKVADFAECGLTVHLKSYEFLYQTVGESSEGFFVPRRWKSLTTSSCIQLMCKTVSLKCQKGYQLEFSNWTAFWNWEELKVITNICDKAKVTPKSIDWSQYLNKQTKDQKLASKLENYLKISFKAWTALFILNEFIYCSLFFFCRLNNSNPIKQLVQPLIPSIIH